MQKKWWHGKVAYQIYPKSFKDSNGDGVGDVRGIIEKLPYLHALGIELLWISPIYKSPFVDQGYDIADYQAIDPIFGSLDDVEELIAKAKALNIKIIMDLVVNHCSSEHEWFKKACADPTCEEASYFYFREGKNGRAPNNLRANFGGSVWDKVPGHEDENLYYCHFFAKEQPDLNWFNPKLRQKIYDMMNWWLDKGIAGFRVDAIKCIGKDPSFPDYPADELGDGMCGCGRMNAEHNEVADRFLREMQQTVLRPRDAFTVGEVFGLKRENTEKFIGDDGNFSTIFDFSAREYLTKHCAYYAYEKMSVKEYRQVLFAAQETVGDMGMLAPVIENHDEPRGVSSYLPMIWQNAQGAKALGTINVLLKGIPFIFQGQEIGMTNTHFDSIYEFDDLQSHEEYRRCLDHGLTQTQALEVLNAQARDHARTPMLWDDSRHAGFSSVTPWMKIHQDYHEVNVKAQQGDPNSVLSYYKKLIALRKDPRLFDTLTWGRFEALPDPNDHTIAFRRVGEVSVAVAANFGEKAVELNLDAISEVLLSCGDIKVEGNTLILEGGAAAVILQ